MKIRKLSEELALKAKNELFEDPARIPQDLKIIKEWIAQQPHITARTDDQWLVNFLRGSKFSLEKAKEKLDLFYTMKTMAPEMTMPLDPLHPIVQEVIKAGIMLPLNKTLEPDGPRIMLMRPGAIDLTKISMLDFVRVGFMYTYVQLLEDDHSVVAGQTVIIDMSYLTMTHFTQMPPSLMKKMVLTRQDSIPMRQKAAHHVNAPAALEKIFHLVKVLLNDKMKNRFFIHSDMEQLHKLIPKSILPVEYGGENGTIQDITNEWKVRIENHRDWFLEEAKYKTDESKRPGAPKTSETMFGIDGSFRKLDYD